jgi:hypothetical protein
MNALHYTMLALLGLCLMIAATEMAIAIKEGKYITTFFLGVFICLFIVCSFGLFIPFK